MATLAVGPQTRPGGDEWFFLRAAIIMALLIVAGFSLNIAMGRSSFASPPLVHAHAIVFMGWVAIFLSQNVLAATGNIALHRRLGWLAAGWTVLMVVFGCLVTVAMVQRGQVPFFFRPQHFLVFDPMALFGFAGLTYAAIALRKQTGWHRRLHYCGMALLLGPGIGRLLPLPLLTPWSFETVFAVSLLFPLAGVVADLRRSGRVHPAWGWGIAAMLGTMVITEGITYSPVGTAIYTSVTAGTPGAAVPPLTFAPRPMGPRITGRTN